MKLKFKLVKFDKMLVFEILEQDKRFIKDDYVKDDYFVASNGLKVSSEIAFLKYSTIGLLGYGSKTDKVISHCKPFDCNKTRDNFYNRVLEALEEWANHAKEFKEDKLNYTKEGNIYTWSNGLKIKIDTFGKFLTYIVLNGFIDNDFNIVYIHENNYSIVESMSRGFCSSEKAQEKLEYVLKKISNQVTPKKSKLIDHGNGLFEV